MKSLRLVILSCCTLPLLFFAGCKPSLPSDVIDESKMEDILYDYHIAQGMLVDNIKLNEQRMYNDILAKHGVTQAEFDSSMVYYTRHYHLLNGIYSKLQDRFTQQTVAMGGNVQDITSMGEGFSSSDTTNLWKETPSVLFVPFTPYNVKQFDIKVDTTFLPGDKILLSFDTQFLVQDGRRDVAAMLAIRLSNDSVVFNTYHASNSMHSTIIVEDNERCGIKELKGFLTFNSDWEDNRVMTKIALIQNIKLIRMHTKDPETIKEEQAKADSLNNLEKPNNTENHGIQETQMDSARRPALNPPGRKSPIFPEKRLPDTDAKINQNIVRN